MDSLYLVMPAYNEEKNIEAVVRAWYPAVADKGEASRMVIADSGSTDGTHAKLEALQKEFPKLEILSNTGKQHGPKVIALYRHAIERGATYIFQTDSDGQTNPDEFAAFWKLRERYAGIFGYRKERGDGKIRAFVERVVCLLLSLYFHVNVPDANAPFRLMRAEVVAKYLPRMSGDYNLPNIMLTTFFSYYGERIRFRKISFKPRQAGVNSVNVRKIVGIGIKALGDFHRFKKAMLADEVPAETLEAWDPDAEPKAADDIPDMPKTVYVMNPAESVLSAPEKSAKDSVPETQADTAETPDADVTETPDAAATETQADTTETPEKSAKDSVPETQADTTETPEKSDAAAPETPDAAAPETPDEPESESGAPEMEPDAPEAQAHEPETLGTRPNAPETETLGTKPNAPETESDAAEVKAEAAETESGAPETESDAAEVKAEAAETESGALETESDAEEVKTEGGGTPKKSKASPGKRPAKKNGRHAPRKIAIKPRNGKES